MPAAAQGPVFLDSLIPSAIDAGTDGTLNLYSTGESVRRTAGFFVSSDRVIVHLRSTNQTV
jgi:hypothetical protein